MSCVRSWVLWGKKESRSSGGGGARSGAWGLSSNFQNDLFEKMQILEGEQPKSKVGAASLCS